MIKSTKLKFFFTILLIFVSTNTLAFDYRSYESKLKKYDFYNFTNPPEVQKEKDYYGNYIKNIYYTAIAQIKDEPYQFTNIDKYRVVKSNSNFELKYYLGPVLAIPANSTNFYCFQNLPISKIDNRFYFIPFIEGLDSQNASIKAGEYRIVHSNTIYKDFSPNSAEKSYKYFDFVDGKLLSLNPFEVQNKQFTVCIESFNNQYPTNNKETLEIIYKVENENAKEEVTQMIRRSYFGMETTPDLNINNENERILNIKKTNDRTTIQSKSIFEKLLDFSFAFLPLIVLSTIPAYFLFRFIKSKLREQEINKKINDIESYSNTR